MPDTEAGMRAYHATFALDAQGVWLVEVDEIPEVHTFGKTLGKAREYLFDALALWLDVPVHEVRDHVTFGPPPLPHEVLDSVATAIAERDLAEAASRVAREHMREASVLLVRQAHLSMRDAADILGISHQRVQQLVARSQAG
jgi:predicted RNase H-like HicB family nuclease/predicted XRE-type DNA-binding protein